MGGDDINSQLMFLLTCKLRLKNVVTELSFSDIFSTALHFAEKFLSVPVLELCHKQRGSPSIALVDNQHPRAPHVFPPTAKLPSCCLGPYFARCGGISGTEAT